MAQFGDPVIEYCVDYLLTEILMSGRSPRDVEGAVMHAVQTWMQAHCTLSEWRRYKVDGYEFRIRRLANGKLEIGRRL